MSVAQQVAALVRVLFDCTDVCDILLNDFLVFTP
jgi:hypothetical protein